MHTYLYLEFITWTKESRLWVQDLNVTLFAVFPGEHRENSLKEAILDSFQASFIAIRMAR
jgi:hypothetical protein